MTLLGWSFFTLFIFKQIFTYVKKQSCENTFLCYGVQISFFLQGRNNIFLVPMTREWNTKTTCFLTMGSQPFSYFIFNCAQQSCATNPPVFIWHWRCRLVDMLSCCHNTFLDSCCHCHREGPSQRPDQYTYQVSVYLLSISILIIILSKFDFQILILLISKMYWNTGTSVFF